MVRWRMWRKVRARTREVADPVCVRVPGEDDGVVDVVVVKVVENAVAVGAVPIPRVLNECLSGVPSVTALQIARTTSTAGGYMSIASQGTRHRKSTHRQS